MTNEEYSKKYLEVVSDVRFKLFGLDRQAILKFRETQEAFMVSPQQVYDIVKEKVCNVC